MPVPLIGVSTYLEQDVRWGVWQHQAAVLPAGYHRLVQQAGGYPVLLPPDAPERAAEVLARLDGLVLSGGPDVEPVRYGAAPQAECGPPSPERDTWELALTEAALPARLPLLGICRGMQVLNVALGGTLLQHLEGHRGEPGVFDRHPVRPVDGTALARALPEPVSVPTYHHQAVDALGSDLLPSAHAADGTVEGLELPAARHPFALAVQWHPEEGDDVRVMRALVEAAGAADEPAGDTAPVSGNGERPYVRR